MFVCVAECWDEPEPVGEGHHDVQRSQEEDEVEEEVAVRHPLALVVDHPLAAFALVVGGEILLDWKRRDEDRQVTALKPRLVTRCSLMQEGAGP